MTSPQPPSWAQGLVALFVPARGARGADRWYGRQAFGFLWRWCLPWGLLVSAIMIARDIYDLTLPTNDFRTRAAVTTYTCISVFAMGGFVAAWRSRRASSGLALGAVAALITCGIATLYALTAGAMLLNTAVAANPQAYAALVEANDVPIIPIIVLGALAGSIGGAIGKAIGRGSKNPLSLILDPRIRNP